MDGIRRILHATDFSPASRPAFGTALRLARRSRARMLLLHVMVPPSPFIGDGRPPSSYMDLLVHARRAARRRLAAAVARARRTGVPASAVLVEGLPTEEILRAARRPRADVIVLGTHGRTGLRRAFMGSVAERVVTQARCPVLTVHP
jgi:nucleotide-binding universal stress UspA family protein